MLTLVWRFLTQRVTDLQIAWIKYWAFQRRFVARHTVLSFRRALAFFVVFILVIYFVVGLPALGYLVYIRRSGGVALAIAANIYPFPVATVGGDVILLKPYFDRLTYLRYYSQQTQQPLPPDDAMRKQIIDKLIDEAVVRQWANKHGIFVTNQDIDAAYQKIIQDKGSEAEVRTVLSQLYSLTDTEFKRLIPDVLYQEKIEILVIERVHVKHILLSSEQQALKVRGELDNSNFNDKAKLYSDDKTTRDTGGDLGFFDRARAEKLTPELAKVFFELQPGQISGPVKTQYGYHLIFLTERTGAEQTTFAEWRDTRRAQTKIRRFLK